MRFLTRPLILAAAVLATACTDSTGPNDDRGGDDSIDSRIGSSIAPATQPASSGAAAFLVLDEDAIDNGLLPNDFSETDVNDDIARKDQRRVLRWFEANVGREIEVISGEVGGEGFHALTAIPSSWLRAGNAGGGVRNFLAAAPGLGGNDNDDLLDKVPGVRPLRARGLTMLRGQAICAIVLDSDVSTNYSPLDASLKGEALGTVAFDVVSVRDRRDGSSGDLPYVRIRVRDARATCGGPLALFSNAPVPRSSSEPFDIRVPATVPAPILVAAP
jgi:hypothetical protein